MKVTIRYGHTTSRIETGTISPVTANALSEAMCFEPAGAKYMAQSGKFGGRFSGKQWDGKKRLYHKGHRTFPTGLLHYVLEILDEHGYEVETQDFTALHNATEKLNLNFPGPEWALRDYQEKVVQEAILYGRGMLKVATGGGKTVIAGHIISRLAVQTIFLVHTKDLLYQAYNTFAAMFGEDVGIVGDGRIEPDVITVMTIQTAARALGVDYKKDSYAEGEDSWMDKTITDRDEAIARLLQGAGLVIMDECHRVASESATEVMSAIKNAPYRFGLSASPWRDDGADLALEGVFADRVCDVSASSLIDQGHLVKPYIRIKSVPAARFTKKDQYPTIYEQYVVDNEARNLMVIRDAADKIKRELPTMILVRSIKHGHVLTEMLSSALGEDVPFLSGQDDSDTRNSVIGDMRAGKLRSLVATTIADEGLDIKPLAGLVLAGGGKSSTRALQRVGRVLRPYAGKRYAEVTDFEDNARLLLDHSKARIKMYESEPRFVVTDV
jgi:superfamily II DNA or RNA helicase